MLIATGPQANITVIRLKDVPKSGDIYLIRKDQTEGPGKIRVNAIQVIFGERPSSLPCIRYLRQNIPYYNSVITPIDNPEHWRDPTKRWYKPSTWRTKK